MKLYRFLAFSLALHAALLAAFFLRRHSEIAVPETVIVELPELPAAALSKGSLARTPAPKGNTSPHLSLSAFVPAHKPDLRPVRPGELPLQTTNPDGFSPYAASEDILKSASPEQTGALAWVYRKAQFTIGYPGPFIRHGIEGNAEARLVFDKSGKLKPELMHVTAASPYLKVYVHRMLESTFNRESIPANLVRWPDTFEVFCYVTFSFTDYESKISVTSNNPIVGNKLFFARRSLKSSLEKLQWNLGPVHGLFPIPVVGVDMLWFARKYEEHQHPLRAAAEADDLAPFRKDPLFYD